MDLGGHERMRLVIKDFDHTLALVLVKPGCLTVSIRG